MKPTFLGHNRPLLTAMVQQEDPESCISVMRNAIYDGADAFGVQLCNLPSACRTEEEYRRIFCYAEDLPIYVTNYRAKHSAGLTDEERAEGLLLALWAGATLCDVMGDLFGPAPLELSRDPHAIARQEQLIGRIHSMGGEVLMSCHTGCFLPPEQVLEIAKAQEARGADIAKIVTQANSEEELLENLRASLLMKRELNIPFLFLANGSHCKLQRIIGPMFGSVMVLCVQQYTNRDSREQPLLRAARDALLNIDWKPCRP